MVKEFKRKRALDKFMTDFLVKDLSRNERLNIIVKKLKGKYTVDWSYHGVREKIPKAMRYV
jgi:hypothetical protein